MWGLVWGVSVGSWGCEVRAGCPRRCIRWVVGWAWPHLSAGSSPQHPTSRLPEAFLCPSLREVTYKVLEGISMQFPLNIRMTYCAGWWRSDECQLSLNRQTRTMCSEQGLSSEEGGLQHVCRLHDQHVLQPAQVLKLQSLVGLKGQSRRHVRCKEK